jgi:hypothetical protein
MTSPVPTLNLACPSKASFFSFDQNHAPGPHHAPHEIRRNAKFLNSADVLAASLALQRRILVVGPNFRDELLRVKSLL